CWGCVLARKCKQKGVELETRGGGGGGVVVVCFWGGGGDMAPRRDEGNIFEAWVEGGGTNATVEPDGSVNVIVEFNPDNESFFDGVLIINSNDPQYGGEPYMVNLSGSGYQAQPQISVDPGSIDFGEVAVDDTEEITLTIHNNGDGELEIEDIYLEADECFDYSYEGGGSIGPGGSEDVIVMFSPYESGEFGGDLTIVSNDRENNEVYVSLHGMSFEPQPSISVDPQEHLDFGEVIVGQSGQETVTVSNTGEGDLEIDIEVQYGHMENAPRRDDGEIFDAWIGEGGNYSVTIEPDGEVEITVEFNPDEENNYEAELIIYSNDQDNEEVGVYLSGEGIMYVYNVPDDFNTIQAAINAADDGDTVLVADGTYTGEGNRDISFDGKEITVKSENGPDNCIIDCQDGGIGFFFTNGEGQTSILEGFSVVNGNSNEAGAVFIDDGLSPIILNCVFEDCQGDFVGAIRLGNDAGCSATPSIIRNCTFRNCTSDGNAAIIMYAEKTWIENCLFENNTGGTYIVQNAFPEPEPGHIWNCTFIGNHSVFAPLGLGHGYVAEYCVFSDNVSTNCAGAVMGTTQWRGTTSIINCTLYNNTVENRSINPAADWHLTVVNCILWGEDADQQILTHSNNYHISYTDAQGGWEGEGNIDSDPLFINPDNNDFHLTADSPCIDVGDPDSDPDPDDTRADMGALYFHQEPAEIVIDPASLNFETIFLGQQRELSFTITNSGEENHTITDITVEGETFSVDFEEEFELEPDAQHTVTVSFHPEEEAEYSADVIISSDLMDEQELTVGLSGEALTRNVSIVGSIDIPGSVLDVSVFGQNAFIANSEFGIRSIDISNPEEPDTVELFPLWSPSNIHVENGFANVAAPSGFNIIDVFNPERMERVSRLEIEGGFDISGDYAYCLGAWGQLNIIDISDVANPESIGDYDLRREVHGIAVEEGYAYIAAYGGGLMIMDISDHSEPVIVGNLGTPNMWPVSVQVRDQIVYLSAWPRGSWVVDVSDPTDPVQIGEFNDLGATGYITLHGNYLYYSGYGNELMIVDISVPNRPMLAATVNTPNTALGMDVKGDFAFVADNESGLQIIDISELTSDPGYPEIGFEPTFVDFAHQMDLEASELEIEIINIGHSPLTITDAQTSDESFSLQFPGEFSLDPGDSRSLTVTFDPQENGVFRETLIVSSTDINQPQFRLPLRGSARNEAFIRVPEDFQTIQAAIDAARDGDEINVVPGEYVENIDFLGKNISVIGNPFNPASVVIDGDDRGYVVDFANEETNQSVLSGFTIQNGHEDLGGGIHCYGSSPTIQNCVIQNNIADGNGGGIHCIGAEPIINNCVIRENTSDQGGGIYCNNESNVTVTYSLIYGNLTSEQGGAFAIYDHSSISLSNVTVYANECEQDAGIFYCGNGSSVSLVNTIVHENIQQLAICYENGDENRIAISFCDIEGGIDAIEFNNNVQLVLNEDNIDEDPLFADPENNDFHLTENSPCINAGDPDSPDDPDGSRADMGAYYYSPDGDEPRIINVPDDYETIQIAINAAQDGDEIIVAPGEYYESIDFSGKNVSIIGNPDDPEEVTIDGSDNARVVTLANGESNDAVLNGFTIRNGIAESGSGISCSGASPTLLNLIVEDNYATDIGGGMYFAEGSLPLLRNLVIRSNGCRNYGAGICADDESILEFEDGTVISNRATALWGGGIAIRSGSQLNARNVDFIGNSAEAGGGIAFRNSDGSLTGCLFEGNACVGGGGGVAMETSDIELTDVVIRNNRSQYHGGGVGVQSSNPILTRVVISGNTAGNAGSGIDLCNASHLVLNNSEISFTVGYSGVEISSESEATITNCTIYGNQGYGLRLSESGQTFLNNSIIWGNTQEQILFDHEVGSLSTAYSDIQGGLESIENREGHEINWGDGMIDADPLFADPGNGDFNLTADSPCIDSGDPESDPDPDDTRADMGALYFHQDDHVLNVPDDYETIQAAIDASEDGDTVQVEAGTYEENINFNGKDIVVMGNPDDPGECIIDGGGEGTVVTFENGETDAAVLDGFTIRNGNADAGGGIVVWDGDPILQNLIVTGNEARVGGGLFINASDLILRNSLVHSNTGRTNGAGMVIQASHGERIPTIEDVVIRDNNSQYGGGIHFYQSEGILNRVAIYNNSADGSNGGGIHCTQSSPEINNCTVSRNTSNTAPGGIFSYSSSNPVITNSIFWENDYNEMSAEANSGFTVSYSDVQSGWEGEGNIDDDPLFADPDQGDFNLTEDSPCIDAGNPESDEDPDGTYADMGAFYFEQDLIIDITPNILEFGEVQIDDNRELNLNVTNIGEQDVTITDIAAAGDWFSVAFEGEFVIEPDGSAEVAVTFAPEESGFAEDLLTISTDYENQAESEVHLSGRGVNVDDIFHVPDEYETIQAAIDAASNGDTVLVAPGEYVENISFNSKDIVVLGNPDDPSEVVIDGGDDGSVVAGQGTGNAELNGFTIQNGNAGYGGGIVIWTALCNLKNLIVRDNTAGVGGGLTCRYGGTTSLENVIFLNNTATGYGGGLEVHESGCPMENVEMRGNHANGNGGAMYLNSTSPAIRNVTMISNSAGGNGGAVFHDAGCTPYFYNSVICNNSAGGDGGGIHGGYNPRLFNVTMSGNTAENSGGALYGGYFVFNSIVWGNEPQDVAGNTTFSYSDVGGEWEGEGNIDSDPLFVDPDNDDFHLTADSPCIDTGDPESDQDPDETRADMGALYFHQEEDEGPEGYKIIADDRTLGDKFGGSASIDSNYVLVGAMYDNATGDDGHFEFSGSAYIFAYDGNDWIQQAKLISDDPVRNAYFGGSVSINGDYAVVGAATDYVGDDHCGAAYLFVRDGEDWDLLAKLSADDRADADQFGSSVSIDGDYIAVGAKQEYGGNGAVYIFARDGENWVQQAKMTADDGAEEDYFGNSVSISGNYLVVGAYGKDGDVENSGSAHVFIRDGANWSQQTCLTADDAGQDDYFGGNVSLSDDYIIVGAYNDEVNDVRSGSAYIFIRDGENWTQQAKLTADDGSNGDRFGLSVSLSGDNALIGADQDQDNGANSGSVYLFTRDGANWTQNIKITEQDGAAGNYFGNAVALNGDLAVVGSYNDDLEDDDGGANYGSAYIYSGFAEEQDETPSIAVSPESLNFGEVAVNNSEDLTLTISNEGNADLTISDISIDSEYFSTNFDGEFTIEPDGEHQLTVTFAPDEFGVHEGTLTIASNDPDNEEMTIDLTGFGLLEQEFELADDITITMVKIPAGSFMMGAQGNDQDALDFERPRHRVNLDYDFWIGKYEFTQAQWQAVMGNNPSRTRGENHPVDRVSWNDVQDLEESLNNEFRLPSEAEWEYACRAGHDETRFWWGDDPNYEEIHNYAWRGVEYELLGAPTHEVGQLAPNPWGLYDILGNLYEWCEDEWHDNYNGAPDDGSAWLDGDGSRKKRGGCMQHPNFNARPSSINANQQNEGPFDNGFRLVRSVSVPDIAVSPEALDFGEVVVNNSEDLTLTISNEGNANLTISEITVDSEFFSVNFEGELVIEPDGSEEVTVTFAPEEFGLHEGVLTINSDDPDQNGLTVDLTGFGLIEQEFELADGVNITMVRIPAGSFMMGAQDGERDAQGTEYPRHRVTLEYDFWMGKYEVTQAQWERVMGDNPAHDYGVGDNYPVYSVTWTDIQGFEERLVEGFRLPSEAEWEYACRAGHDETRFFWGDDNDYEEIYDYAVFNDNNPNGVAEVSTKRPNPWGLYDMSGNIYEWCEDWYHGNYNGAPDDGSPWIEGGGQMRVLKGGAWFVAPEHCRSALRGLSHPDDRHYGDGFRLVFTGHIPVTINVPDDFETIQTAINAADHGDIVQVETGTYEENINFNGKNITVRGNPDDPGECIIDGEGDGSVVAFVNGETQDAVLIGFTIQNGNAQNGGGVVSNGANPTLANSIIIDNAAQSGGGIYCLNSVITLNSVYIGNNQAESLGGGLCMIWSSGVFDYVNIVSNASGSQGGGIHIHGCTSPQFRNCTFAYNSANDAGGGILLYCHSILSFVNTIFWGNEPEQVHFSNDAWIKRASFAYCDVEGGNDMPITNGYDQLIWGDGNIETDPLFVDSDEGDFHLTENSPCIDVGDPDSDLDPDETRADMGAYYFHQEDEPHIVVSPEELDFGEVLVNNSEDLTLTISNEGDADLTISDITVADDYFSTSFDGEFTIEPDGEHQLTVTFAPDEAGEFEGTLTIDSNDPDEGEIWVTLAGIGIGEVRLLGHYDTPGIANGVFISGDYAYIADGENGLGIVDVSDPENPNEVGRCDTPDFAYSVTTSGNYAFVADNNAGLRIIDISDPENPNEIGYYDTPGEARAVEVVNDYAFIANGWEGFRVIDISNLEEPQEVAVYDTPWTPWDVAISGELAYVADGTGGLRIIDISDPENPDEIGYFDHSGDAWGVTVSGHYAFIADRHELSLRVFDVSDPENPEDISTCDTPGSAYSVAVSGHYAYVAVYQSGLRVIDISDIENLEEVAFYDTDGNARDVFVRGEAAYVADLGNGLVILDISDFVISPPEIVTDPGAFDEALSYGDINDYLLNIINLGDETLNFEITKEVVSEPGRDARGRSLRRIGSGAPRRDDAGEVLYTVESPIGANQYKNLGYDSENNRMWNIQYGSPHRTLAFDLDDNNAIVADLELNVTNPMDIAIYNETIYIMSLWGRYVARFDFEGNIVGNLDLDVDDNVIGVAVDAENELLIVGTGSNNLFVYNLQGERVAQINNNGSNIRERCEGRSWRSLEWVGNHTDGELWVHTQGQVFQIDVDTDNWAFIGDENVQTFAVHSATEWDGMAHDGSDLWVSSYHSATINIYDDGITETVWLLVNPNSGSIDANGEVDVTVTLSAENADAGDYEANLIISSNDPDNPEIEVNVIMQVDDAPNIFVEWDTEAFSSEEDNTIDWNSNYGFMFTETAYTAEVWIHNRGSEDLVVESVGIEGGYFTVEDASFTLSSDESETIEVTFESDEVSEHSAVLSISSNDPDEEVVEITLLGETFLPPVISVSPQALSVSLGIGGSENDQFNIANEGESLLSFTTDLEYISEPDPDDNPQRDARGRSLRQVRGNRSTDSSGPMRQNVPILSQINRSRVGADLSRPNPPRVGASISRPTGFDLMGLESAPTRRDRSSDPDDAGYEWRDNDEEGGPEFDWIDLNEFEGVQTYELSDDQNTGALELGWLFPFWDREFENIFVDSDGWTSFTYSGIQVFADQEESFPLQGRIENCFQVANYDYGNAIIQFWTNEEDQAVITWVGNQQFNYQLILNASGLAVYQYGEGFEEQNMWRVGVNYGDGEHGWAISRNEADYLHNGLAIGIGGASVWRGDWVSWDPQSGDIEPENNLDITVSFDAENTVGGIYEAEITIHSNDPQTPDVVVALQMNIEGEPEMDVVWDEEYGYNDDVNWNARYDYLYTGFAYDMDVEIRNIGSDWLSIPSIEFNSEYYSVDASEFDIFPGNSHTLTVTMGANEDGEHYATMMINSNDPDNGGEVALNLSAITESPPVIRIEPDHIAEELGIGETSDHGLTVFNDGASGLDFDIELESISNPNRDEQVRQLRGVGRNGVAPKRDAAGDALGSLEARYPMNSGMAWDGEYMWAIATEIGRIYALNIESGETVNEFEINSSSLCLAFDGERLWSYSLNQEEEMWYIVAYDLDGQLVFERALVENSADLIGLAADRNNHLLMNIGIGEGTTIYVFDIDDIIGEEEFEPVGMIELPSGFGEFVQSPGGRRDADVEGLVWGNLTWVTEHPDGQLWVNTDSEAEERCYAYQFYINENWEAEEVQYFEWQADNPAAGLAHDDTNIWHGNVENANWMHYDDGIAEGMSWLSIDPMNGEINPDGELDIGLFFDANDIYGGLYEVDLHFNSNDPETPEVVINIQLDVTGAAHLEVEWSADAGYPDEINWNSIYEDLFNDTPYDIEIIIRSTGSDDLEIDNFAVNDGNFAVNDMQLSIRPEHQETVIITLHSTENGEYTGTLSFDTNDPDAETIEIALNAVTSEPPAVDIFPSLIRAYLSVDESVERTITVSNTGGSDLRYTTTQELIGMPDQGGEGMGRRDREHNAGVITGSSNRNASVLAGNSRNLRTITSVDSNIANQGGGPQRDDWIEPISSLDIDYSANTGLTFVNGLMWGIDYEEAILYAVDLDDGSTVHEYQIHEYPYGLAFDGENFWIGYVPEDFSNQITIYDMDGEQVEQFNLGVEGIAGIASDREDYIFVNEVRGFAENAFYQVQVFEIESHSSVAEFELYIPEGEEFDFSYWQMTWVQEHTDGHLWVIVGEPMGGGESAPRRDEGTGVLLTQYNIDGDWNVDCIGWLELEIDDLSDGIAHDSHDMWVGSFEEAVLYAYNDGIAEYTLGIAPSSGTVEPDAETDVTVAIDATDLAEGLYESDIIFHTNDPQAEEIRVNVEVHIGEDAGISVEPGEPFDFGEVLIGERARHVVEVSNIGNDVLVLNPMRVNNDQGLGFTSNLEGTFFELEPGDMRRVIINFIPNQAQAFTGQLHIECNDPDREVIDVELAGQGVTPPPDIYLGYLADDDPGISFTEHTIDGDFDGPYSVYATDVDGDGNVDVLGVSYYADDITWWKNDGSENFTEHIIEGDFDGAVSVYATDVDGDDDIDVLGTAYLADDITWWENDGNENFTEHTIKGDFNDAWAVYATDVDSDGDIDVLGSAKNSHNITWWENDGSENFTEHTINGNYGGASSVYATDVDGDGDIDVLGAASGADDITWWENDGSENFTEHTIDGDFDGAYSVSAIDVDGDGDIDVLGAASSADDITWWENDGNENFTEHTIDGDFDGARSVYATDVNGDGDIDVLGAAGNPDDITWWENDGTPANGGWTEHTIAGDFDLANSVYATDVDGDGDVDVLGTAYNADDITWWENTQEFTWDFGEVEKDSSATWTFRIYNHGIDQLVVEDISSSNEDVFTTDFDGEISVDAGEFFEVEVAFTPDDYADFEAALEITSNDPDEETQVVQLSGTGVFVNYPPEVINDISDLQLPEDFDAFVIAELDTIFEDPNPEHYELTFEVLCDREEFTVELIEGYQLLIDSDDNWFGNVEITITADDNFGQLEAGPRRRDRSPTRRLRSIEDGQVDDDYSVSLMTNLSRDEQSVSGFDSSPSVSTANGPGLSRWGIHNPDDEPRRDDETDMVVNVQVNPENDPPEWVDVPEYDEINEDDNLTFNVQAEDVDGDDLELSAVSEDLPEGWEFTDNGDGTGSFDWTPSFEDAGSYEVTFTVSDGELIDEAATHISVYNINRAPDWDDVPETADVNENGLLEFTVTGSDPDAEDEGNLTIGVGDCDLPEGWNITDNGDGTADFSWRSGFDDAGEYSITFELSDDEFSVDAQVAITVLNVNREPVLSEIGDQEVNEGDELTFTLEAFDPDDDAFAFSAVNLPDGAELNGADFVWTPDNEQAGEYDVTFIVTD
ncbi:MAG: choice-of-anchor D domain-containing protein, partial [Candidatus Hatepunaea meridiana]|nr:choice-of-anchor D domain-containing protein [Candidatus Hatepunaea meridiana]